MRVASSIDPAVGAPELRLCLQMNRFGARPRVLALFATVSRLGDGIAWYLLMLLSFVLVSLVHRPRPPGEGKRTNPLTSPAQRGR